MITHQFKPLPLLVVVALVVTLGIAALPAYIALAACPPNVTLNLTLLNDPHLLVDSTNPASGPQVTAAYATITNNGTATAYDVYMYIGNGTTPGTFTPGSDGQKLSMLGSAADATRFIGNLAASESKTVYWMLKYPLTDGETYPMTIWASSADGCFVQGSHNYTTQSTIRAAANKMLGTVTLDPADGQVHVGNNLTVTVTGFNFGVIGFNGDAWLQPVGNLDFNPDQFRLIRTETYIHSIAGKCGYGSMPVYDRLYFPGIRTCYSFNAADYVKYYFVAISEGTTTAKVYQEAASGTQEKYSGDYGKPGATVTFTAHCGGIILWKSVNPQTATANTTLTWTITYRNDSGLPIGDPGTGNGLTVREDAIPTNTTYVAGSATCSGSCIIYYSTDHGVTWNTTEPAPSQLTRIKWFINQVIPAGSTGNVSFQSKVNSNVTGTPLICNSASAGVGDCPFAPTDTVCANGGADLDLIKVVNDHSPCEGSDITYTVTVSNPSTTNATGVNVTDALPPGLTYISSNTSQGTYNSSTGLWNVGNLNASNNATLTLRASVNATTGGTTIINSANITGADQTDPVLLNNSDHDGITVHSAPVAYPASNSPVSKGSTIYLFGGPGGMASYNWTGPDGFTSNQQNPTRPNATLAMAGTYNLTVVDFSGCGIASATINMTVNITELSCNGECCPSYGLMISSAEGGSVTTPGEGAFPYLGGTVVDLVASPDPGYRFVNWTGDVDTVGDVDAASTTITMDDWYSITANFETAEVPTVEPPVQYDLTVSATAGGSVTTPGVGKFTYEAGTPVSLVASPDDGYDFVNWTGNVATIANINAASTTLTMNGDYSITANFEEEEEPPSFLTGCFIATVAYGTPTAEQIDVLREFRDVVLLESTAGSKFVALYYQLSPPVAEFIAGNEFLRTLARELLVDPIVWIVEATGDIWRN